MNNNDGKKDVSKITSQTNDDWVFSNARYICSSTALITGALQNGCDVAQLPNGDIVITEVTAVNIRYVWDKAKQKLVKVSN